MDNHRRKLDTPSDLSKYEEYRKLDKDQIEDMLEAGFEIIPLDGVRKNSNILVGSRYRTPVTVANSSMELVRLGDIATLTRGISFPKNAQKISDEDSLRVITTKAAQASGIDFNNVVYVDKSYKKDERMISKDDILISLANSLDLVGRATYVSADYKDLTFGAFMGLIRVDYTKVNPLYLFNILQSEKAKEYFKSVAKTTTNISNLTFEDLNEFILPLPNLETQSKFATEISEYRQIINSARKLLSSYSPYIVKWFSSKNQGIFSYISQMNEPR